jgi:hypothetical protein
MSFVLDNDDISNAYRTNNYDTIEQIISSNYKKELNSLFFNHQQLYEYIASHMNSKVAEIIIYLINDLRLKTKGIEQLTALFLKYGKHESANFMLVEYEALSYWNVLSYLIKFKASNEIICRYFNEDIEHFKTLFTINNSEARMWIMIHIGQTYNIQFLDYINNQVELNQGDIQHVISATIDKDYIKCSNTIKYLFENYYTNNYNCYFIFSIITELCKLEYDELIDYIFEKCVFNIKNEELDTFLHILYMYNKKVYKSFVKIQIEKHNDNWMQLISVIDFKKYMERLLDLS